MRRKSIRCRLILLSLLLIFAIPFFRLNAALADEAEDASEEAVELTEDVEEKACIAQLHFESEDGKYSNISENSEVVKDAPGTCYVKVEGGTFTVKLKIEDLVPGETTEGENADRPEKISGVKVLCVDISGVKQLLNDYNFKLDVSDVVVACDGNPIELDSQKLVLGSAEENDNLRIEIYNASGATAADNSPIDAAGFEFSKNLSVTFTMQPTSKGQSAYIVFANSKGRYFSTPEKPKSDPVAVNGDGTYTFSLAAIDSEGDKVKVSGISNFYVEIPGLVNQITDWSEIKVSNVMITCDGEPVDVDTNEIYWGNTKNNGNFRIDFYDEDKKSDSEYKGAVVDPKKFSFRDKLEVTFTIEGMKLGFPKSVVDSYVYYEPVADEEEIEDTEITDVVEEPIPTEAVEEPVPTVAPTPTATPEPTIEPTATPAPIRGLNDISNKRDEKYNDGMGGLAKAGIVLLVIIVLGGGAAAFIYGRE